jgi:hypothetical protein
LESVPGVAAAPPSDSDSYSKKFSFADKKECLRIIEKHLFKYYNIK